MTVVGGIIEAAEKSTERGVQGDSCCSDNFCVALALLRVSWILDLAGRTPVFVAVGRALVNDWLYEC